MSTSSRRELWKGETRESTFAQGRSELPVGSPCEVSIRGWMGWDGSTHTHAFVPDSGCRFRWAENWESTTTNFSPSRFDAVLGRYWPECSRAISHHRRARAGATHVILRGKERPGGGGEVGAGPGYALHGLEPAFFDDDAPDGATQLALPTNFKDDSQNFARPAIVGFCNFGEMPDLNAACQV